MEVLGYVAMVCVGIVLGSVGSGGSMLAIPILVYMFSQDAEAASAYSLFLVGVTSLTGAVLKQKEQFVAVRAALMFGLPSISATFVTRKWIVSRVPDRIWEVGSFQITKGDMLLFLLGSLMIASSLMMMRDSSVNASVSRPRFGYLIPAGLAIGFLSGIVGIGGGFLILPAMVLLGGLSVRTAMGTTLLMIALNSLLGFCGDVFNHAINWYFLFSITGLAVFGMVLGVWADKKIASSFSAGKAFAWFTLLAGVVILVRELVW